MYSIQPLTETVLKYKQQKVSCYNLPKFSEEKTIIL